ncbi:hypothetical protein AC579_5104 [Pseudocercospora musae]|uniref:Uncharacterized protein n=1 Tax=Pseudocercospora musae TaxID=113226 RepID=A0A139IN04_9PEZI|nr:hypothetical protein AC579_5104 [Pseudocercospora musae]
MCHVQRADMQERRRETKERRKGFEPPTYHWESLYAASSIAIAVQALRVGGRVAARRDMGSHVVDVVEKVDHGRTLASPLPHESPALLNSPHLTRAFSHKPTSGKSNAKKTLPTRRSDLEEATSKQYHATQPAVGAGAGGGDRGGKGGGRGDGGGRGGKGKGELDALLERFADALVGMWQRLLDMEEDERADNIWAIGERVFGKDRWGVLVNERMNRKGK